MKPSDGSRYGFVQAWLVAIWICGCGGAPLPPVPTVAPESRVLIELLPEGALSVVHLRPAQIWGTSLSQVAGAILRPEDLERIEFRFGLRPAEITELVVAAYPGDAVLLIARTTRPVRPIARALAARMNTIETRSEQPFFRRGGYLGTAHREFAVLDPHVLLYGSVSPHFVRAVNIARQPGRPGNATLQSQLAELYRPDRALAFYWLSPLRLAADSMTGLLFAQEERLALSIDAEGSEFLRLSVVLEGEFPRGAGSNIEQLMTVLSQSDMGRFFGLDRVQGLRIETCGQQPPRADTVDEAEANRHGMTTDQPSRCRTTVSERLSDSQRLHIDLRWPLLPLSEALSRVFAADLRGMLEPEFDDGDR